MRSVIAAVCSLVLMGLCAGGVAGPLSVDGETAWDTGQVDAPIAAAYPKSWTADIRLDAVDPAQIEALHQYNAQPGRKAVRIGVEREVMQSMPALRWQTQADGSVIARLAVTSPEAASLRVALQAREWPEGAELRFASAERPMQALPSFDHRQIRTMTRAQPLVWSPLSRGATQWVEVKLRSADQIRWLELSVKGVAHVLVSPEQIGQRMKFGESQACQIDAACFTSGGAAFNAAKNAVASMVFQTDGSSAVCTGTLLNDADPSSQQPYLFSAAHCFTSQAVASTLSTLWFYEASGCNSGVEGSATREVAGGAEVLYGDAASDVLFLRLNNPPPAGSTFLGWDASAISTGTPFVVIHHPAGDAKKYSLGDVTGLGSSELASGSFIQVRYSNAPTEGGSSGSGLLTGSGGELRLRGGLLGGASACENVGSSSPDNSDDYSRFDLAFPNLRSFLQPSAGSDIDYSGAWSNPAQDGWGLVVVRGSSGAYGMYIYHYDEQSTPSWYLSFGGLNGTGFSAGLLTFTGPWFGISPFNPGQVTPRESGTLSVNFTSATTATISFTIDGRSVNTTLNKLVF